MIPRYFQECPIPWVDGPHVECGKWQRLLAEQLLYPGGHLVGQRVEGSVQALTSCIQQSELLYRGQSMSRFCLSAKRATQRSSLDEIAASQKERLDPEKLSRRDLVVDSLLMLDLAGLYRRPSSAWSRRLGCPELVAEKGGCGCLLWALEGLGMLHWGTHRGTGQLAGSRLASSLAEIMMMMLPLSPAGPHLSGELAGFFWGREVLLAVIF